MSEPEATNNRVNGCTKGATENAGVDNVARSKIPGLENVGVSDS